MPLPRKEKIETCFPACRAMIKENAWDQLVPAGNSHLEIDTFVETLSSKTYELNLPEYLPDLARFEKTLCEVKERPFDFSSKVKRLEVNPSLQMLAVDWKNLIFLLDQGTRPPHPSPEQGREFILVWKDPKTGKAKYKIASDEDLLVLKMAVEEINSCDVARQGSIPVGNVDGAVDRAIENGVLLRPASLIRRDPHRFIMDSDLDEHFLVSRSFAIQWHITQACDLRCKHCYDRNSRVPLQFEKALDVLDDLHEFCHERHVKGHVIFTGGNPLLYSDFPALYRAASERGFMIALLGNPTSHEQLQELIAIQRPRFFQVSLEGLSEHNDLIRGPGHFNRVIEFLKILRNLDVYSMVMLTLTRDNMDQVTPLAEMLRGQVDSFFFNRLSMVGEGANLRLPTRDEYAEFLKIYMRAAKDNPIMGLKDNLFNIVRLQNHMSLFDGCTGHGCGAAFNFLAILSDGEVHACRKFPSPVGNIFQKNLSKIYDSEVAGQYREGCQPCRSCVIRPVCGGCLAISHGHGLNIFEERDPYCFMDVNAEKV